MTLRRRIAVAATVALAAAASATAGPATPADAAGRSAAAAASAPRIPPAGGAMAEQQRVQPRAAEGAVNGSANGGGRAASHATDVDRVKEATRNLLRKKIEREIETKRQLDEEGENRQQQQQEQAWGPPTPEELEARRRAKSERIAERRRRAAEKFSRMAPESDVEKVSAEEMRRIAARAKASDPDGTAPKNQWLRNLGWFDYGGGGENIPSDYDPYNDGYADPGYPWDMWAQGYRMLGGFIDCDWKQGDEDDRRRQMRDQNDRDLSGSGMDSTDNACGRWMMWAAYVNPNYQGGGYSEYFGGNNDDGGGGSSATSSLDCHSQNTQWELMGVYRQEFYQYLEQISKHLWAIDEYDYAVALGGLAYMTDADCFQVGNYYAGILPLEGGTFEMSIFSDDACLYPDDSITVDDAGWSSNYGNDGRGRDLNEQDENCRRRLEEGDDGRNLENNGGYLDCDSWYSAQEYTLTEMNEVYDTFRYCTLCIDYPTYQDGYFIGDYGTDDDDLINQCWKFHSHDSFPCNGDCMALGSMQGTILEVQVGKTVFGQEWDGSSNVLNSQGEAIPHSASRLDRIKANLFLTFAGILFVATFLAFAVARGSGRERRSRARSSKSRSLLTPEEKRRARSSSRRRAQSSSRSKSERRSKSRGGEGRSSSKAASSSRKSRSTHHADGSPRKSSRSKSSRSRRHLDDF